ncbi:unnamed protein product [Rhizoctonia solani]|uniref:Thiaminase-2/PQQC domain-containing protein n=1 Tax=Rhizoctonia solani TaxID=456999 RepID=A0A8H3GFP1_9AGAM|nr:unnamed protein product [Rhizoctonia solani]
MQAIRSRALYNVATPYPTAYLSSQTENLNATTEMGQRSFIDTMIRANRDLWDRLIGHLFCSRMGDGTARIEGFKDYAVGDFFFLRNYVRYELGLYSKTDDWDILSTEAPQGVADAVDFANLQLQVCVQELHIPKAKIIRAGPKPQVKAYIDWVNKMIPTEDWFGLHVLMAPCILASLTLFVLSNH